MADTLNDVFAKMRIEGLKVNDSILIIYAESDHFEPASGKDYPLYEVHSNKDDGLLEFRKVE